MKRTPIIFTTLALLFSACNNKNGFTVEGTLQGGAGKTVYFEEITPRDGTLKVGSVTLDKNGNFKFHYDMPYQSFYNLHVNEADYVVLLPRKGETIKVRGAYDSLQFTYQVEGSPESLLLWQLQDYTNQGLVRLGEVVALDRQNQQRYKDPDEYQAAKKATDSTFVDLYNQQVKYVQDFIHDNQGSLATLIALYKPFNNHPLLPPQSSAEFYEEVLQGLEDKQPNNPHTVNFKNTVAEIQYRYSRGQ
ncbi:MAG: DUF4369 domain-containing protein [Bacteroidales bacterium]|nr:DUF4369 domain-containing protein [Bacteroidales bacterium]